jgi:hypothetical protein
MGCSAATAALPRIATAGGTSGARRVGSLVARPRPASGLEYYGGFLQGMRELGYAEDKDHTIQWRWAPGYDEVPRMAAELPGLDFNSADFNRIDRHRGFG